MYLQKCVTEWFPGIFTDFVVWAPVNIKNKQNHSY